jgi:YD repeat-containing protein
VTTNLKYNNLNELTKSTAVSPVSYAYDADGNLTSDGLAQLRALQGQDRDGGRFA